MSEQCGVTPRAAIARCLTALSVTPEDVWNDGKSRTAFEQESGAAWEKYLHGCVKWTLPLKAVVPKGDILEIHFGAGRVGLLTVATRVRADDYPEVKLLAPGTRLNIEGRIESVQVALIALYDSLLSVETQQ